MLAVKILLALGVWAQHEGHSMMHHGMPQKKMDWFSLTRKLEGDKFWLK